MFIPSNAQAIKDIEVPKIMLALQGASATGKTWSACTFPSPLIVDIDNNLVALKQHPNVEHITRLPFHSKDWVSSWFKTKQAFPVRDAVLQWLETEGGKLTNEQTIVLDSWTTLQDAFDKQADPSVEPVYSSNGSINDFAFWDKKIDYSKSVMYALKGLACHVVVTFHEQDTRNAAGQLIGKVEPLMQGKFQKKLGLYFTDWFRCISSAKKADDKKTTIGTEYKWQTQGDDSTNCKTRMPQCPMFVPSTFESFSQYFSTTPQPQTKT